MDDEPNIAMPIQFLMEQQGYNVVVAKSGEEALEIIFKYKPDLIFLDIFLPGIDGYEVCEIVRLNTDFKNIRIIFMTAKRREVEITKGMILGADDYITKPFSNAEVVDTVNKFLKKTWETASLSVLKND